MAITLHHSHFHRTTSRAHASTWATTFAPALRRATQALWNAMEAYGEYRAQQHMARLARNYECTNPDLARQMRVAARALSA